MWSKYTTKISKELIKMRKYWNRKLPLLGMKKSSNSPTQYCSSSANSYIINPVWSHHIYILISGKLPIGFKSTDCKEGEVTIMVQKCAIFLLNFRLIHYSTVNLFLERMRIFHQKPILNLTCHKINKLLLSHIQRVVSILQVSRTGLMSDW